MIYQAKALGASAVLLICSLLDDVKLRNFYQLTKELHMDALVEAHDEKEVLRALDCGAKIIGVNNRDLKTFQVDTGTVSGFGKSHLLMLFLYQKAGSVPPKIFTGFGKMIFRLY